MNDINSPNRDHRRNAPTTPWERVITVTIFLITVVIITWILVNR